MRATYRAVMEHTRPEYPGAFALGEEFPVDTQGAEVLRRVLDGPGAVTDLCVPPEIRERFSIESTIAIAVRPKGDRPYLFGLHQCSHARAWTAAERRLFEEIAHRLEDALTSVLAHRNLLASQEELRTSEQRFRTFVDHATDAFYLFDDEDIVRDVNRQACESLGYTREELIGMHPSQFNAGLTPEKVEWVRRRLHAHGNATFNDLRRQRTERVSRRGPSANFRPRRPPFFHRSRDRHRRATRADAERLNSKSGSGRPRDGSHRPLHDGIAHDFNNVLSGICAYGEMLLDDASGGLRPASGMRRTCSPQPRGAASSSIRFSRTTAASAENACRQTSAALLPRRWSSFAAHCPHGLRCTPRFPTSR